MAKTGLARWFPKEPAALTSLFPKHGAPAAIAARTHGDATRATLPTWGNRSGFQIVRGTQPSDFQGSGAEVRRLGWERHPVVNACARVVVDLIKAVPLEVYREKRGGDEEVLKNHPALDLLRSPRPGLSGGRLLSLTAMHFFLYGNAFWVLERRGTRGAPRTLRVVPPEDIQFVWLADDDSIASYDWRDIQGRIHSREPVENVIHFRDLNGTDGLFGFPRLASALLDILTDTEASQYVRQVVGNSGLPGMVIAAQAGTAQSDLTAAEDRWNEKYATRGNRGMTAFVAGLESVTPIGFNLQQLEFPDLRRVSREDICAAAAVDPRMIGVASAGSDGGLSGEQYREARFRLIQQTVWPIMCALTDELNYWLMPEYGEPLIRFSDEYIAAITEDVTQTSTRMVAELAAKAITVEEFREGIGRPAEMDPTHHLQGGLTVADNAANAVALGAAAVTAADTTVPAPTRPDEATPPAKLSIVRTLYRSQIDDEAPRREQAFERAALLLFAAEAADLARMFAALAAANEVLTDAAVMRVMQRVSTGYSEGGEYARAWTERYTDLITRAVRAGGGDLAAASGLDFSLENPRVRGIVARRTADLVSSVTDTTREAVRAALVTARQQGLSVTQTAKLIADTSFGAITRARAQMIARTEVIGALNAGQFAAAVATGVMRSKTWVANLDDRTRDSHRAIAGETVDIGSAFSNGLRYPHDPLGSAAECINCRCSLTFSDLEAGARQ